MTSTRTRTITSTIGGRENVIPPLRFFNRTRYRARARSRSRSLKVAGEKAMERRARERGR